VPCVGSDVPAFGASASGIASLAGVSGKGEVPAIEPGEERSRNACRWGDAAAKGQGGLQFIFAAGKKIDAKPLQLLV
jgi:hypothetical protein